MEENAPLWYNLKEYPAQFWAKERFQSYSTGMVFDAELDDNGGIRYIAPIYPLPFEIALMDNLHVSIMDVQILDNQLSLWVFVLPVLWDIVFLGRLVR